MNSHFPMRSRRGVAWMLMFAGLLMPVAAHPTAGRFTARAHSVRAKSQIISNDHYAEAGKLKQEIAALEEKASTLEALDSQVDAMQSEVDSREREYEAAKADADAKDAALGREAEDAKSTAQSIAQQVTRICSQLGGSMHGSEQCGFMCPQDQMSPCEQKARSFESQTGALIPKLESLANLLRSLQEKAEGARTRSGEKRRQWEAAKAAREKKQNELTSRGQDFENEAARIDFEIDSARSSWKPTLGPAYQQLNNVHSKSGSVDIRGSCYDTGCAPVTPAPAAKVPEPATKSAAYVKATETRTENLKKLTESADTAREELRKAEANHADAQELQQRLRDYATKDQARIWAAYELKATFPANLLNGVAPTPASH